jgi:hypothetical protein
VKLARRTPSRKRESERAISDFCTPQALRAGVERR